MILHCCCCYYSVSPPLKWKLLEVRVCLCSSLYLQPPRTVLVQGPVQWILNYYVQLPSLCLSLNTSQTEMLLIPQKTAPQAELLRCTVQAVPATERPWEWRRASPKLCPSRGLSTWMQCSEHYSSPLQLMATLSSQLLRPNILEASLIPLSLSHLTVTLSGNFTGSTFEIYQLLSHSQPLPLQPEPLSLPQ